MPPPAFLITVDTEGDDLWSQPAEIATKNARFLPRFQALCEKHGFRPTWLVNYEMAECPEFVALGRDVLARGTGEIGMHLHGWNSPPIEPLTEDDHRHQPYLFEYPEPVMRAKIRAMTELLEARFQRKMVSHRAGRWGLNSTYARLLVEAGYRIDCSVTPHLSWRAYPGDPRGSGGPDFTAFPDRPYSLDLERLDRPGDSPLLEVPLSVIPSPYSRLNAWLEGGPSLARRAFGRFFPPRYWLVPRDRRANHRGMRAILRHALKNGWPCVELATHSSELMPGGSPFFPDDKSIERLYRRLESLFALAAKHFRGMTLEAFAAAFSGR
ncbi:MAG: deacetylase [Pirellulales bacterium]|nr:deacetylase [Pirellulales bacterium]